jgi:two-component system, chemotaxis family, chemotaxis protein CheY
MSVRVLVADDSSTMRKIIIRSLNAIGIPDANITEAGDGEQAIQLFDQGEFHLILTDWNMPQRSGLEVIEAIRSRGSAVPIIMITTEAEKRRILDAIRAGVSDYLIKPFDAEALRGKVEKLCPVHS